jgi:hypothetical protein
MGCSTTSDTNPFAGEPAVFFKNALLKLTGWLLEVEEI